MSETLKKYLPLCGAVIAGALLRSGITCAAFSDITRFSRPDTAGYLEMARHFAEYGNFGNLTGRVPFFPLYCAGFMDLFGDNWMFFTMDMWRVEASESVPMAIVEPMSLSIFTGGLMLDI